MYRIALKCDVLKSFKDDIKNSSAYVTQQTTTNKYYDNGFNTTAFVVTLISVILSLGGKFIPLLEPLSRISWFVGVITAFVLYVLIKRRTIANKTEYA